MPGIIVANPDAARSEVYRFLEESVAASLPGFTEPQGPTRYYVDLREDGVLYRYWLVRVKVEFYGGSVVAEVWRNPRDNEVGKSWLYSRYVWLEPDGTTKALRGRHL